MKLISILNYIFISCSLLMISACGHQKNDSEKIIIAAAANMNYVMKDITTRFTQKTGIACELVVSSSGKLTAQIKEGAPYHIFVSANMKYPNELFESGFSTKKPEIYAYGKLVMWSIVDKMTPSFQTLKNEHIKYIAIANPKTAPYGIAAKEALEYYDLYDHLKDKLVFGESISQTNQFVVSKAAQIGFTSKSVVLSSEMNGKGSWVDIDKSVYSPIAQGAVIIKQKSAVNNNVQQFYTFLFSSDAREILKNFGYTIKDNK